MMALCLFPILTNQIGKVRLMGNFIQMRMGICYLGHGLKMAKSIFGSLNSKIMKIKILQIVVLTMLCAGCNTVTPIGQGTEPSLLLKETQTRNCHYFGMSVKFPDGIYEPGYRTKDGTFYICPTKIIWGYNPLNGGIFVPSAKPDKKGVWVNMDQGVWLDDFGSTRVFRFGEPLVFEFKKS